MDWHAVRAVFRVSVDEPTDAAGDRGGRRVDRAGRLVHPSGSRGAAADRGGPDRHWVSRNDGS